jgi:PIN domain nuclease of toxin-antitoxin system
VRLLLDTHIALWALIDSPKLSREARSFIVDANNEIYFSAASIWEIAIKHALARKDMPVAASGARKLLLDSGYLELPVTAAHAATVELLPLHHGDPFDRMLVAQSLLEPMRLLTHDRQLREYGELIELV